MTDQLLAFFGGAVLGLVGVGAAVAGWVFYGWLQGRYEHPPSG